MESESVPPEHARLLKRATSLSVAVALGLAGAKGVAFVLSGSVAILASLVDSALDVSASLLTAFAVRYAITPADEEHRFGHGKSEALAGLAQAAFIMTSAVFLIVHAVEHFTHPRPLLAVPAARAIMVLSIAVTGGLVHYQRRVVRTTSSQAVAGDSLHYVSDLVTNFGTIVALLLASAGWPQADAVIAIAIAGAITYSAMQIAWTTLQVLMDRELPSALQAQIRELALAHAEVRGVHDLRTRASGHAKLIQLHLEMDGRITLADAHRISDEVEQAILAAIPGADVVIHQDPTGLPERRQFN